MSDPLLETMLRVASEASALVKQVYDSNFIVKYKAPRDPVTEADERANELICNRLRAAFPEIPVVAEESEEGSFADFRDHERVFFVDPVDGTRDFVAKNGEFVVMIGLLQEDRATHGVISAPVSNTSYAGVVGLGAWRYSGAERTPIRVSERETLQSARVVSSRSRRNPALEQALEEYGAQRSVLGSAGLKAVAIAEGDADLYLSLNRAGKRWDACACEALVTAAGGLFTDQHGHRMAYRAESRVNDRGVLAASRGLHQRVLELLQSRTPQPAG
jgi:3'(2'), 5'-bisphosphate nucleotidase